MPRRDFNKVALRRGCSPVNLLHIFRTFFAKNTSERLLLHKVYNIAMQILRLYEKVVKSFI